MILEDLRRAISEHYSLQKITKENIQDVFLLMKGNTYYYSRTPFREVSLGECEAGIEALPPHTKLTQKYYIAFYKESDCVAILDYIEGYPNSNVVYLGLFMLNPKYQGTGLGKEMIRCFIEVVIQNQFKEIKLACYEVNERGYRFWRKMGLKVEKESEKESERETDGKMFKLLEMNRIF